MKVDFSKYMDGLIPVIIQDAVSNKVLMLGFMNEEALAKSQAEKRITFYSRSRRRLWTKGETSGNFLLIKEIIPDCDNDTLLIKAVPAGPACHTGTDTCFNETNSSFSLKKLEEIIGDRKDNPSASSYTTSLFEKGISKIAQKVGEEAVELVIESTGNDEVRFLNEAADLMYHYLVLLQAKKHQLDDVVKVLAERHQ
ncbi:MAG: bifunctional phosphoribosyl-AMP cyclohydrolase/phosphoribosyl-ATP diphosphatase [Sphingobacteriales bacterium UTBCD1]|jgi:phosphoribosyl-ATP pyrophosphohydrolase/phosphoribosyl-AMP cyclohydrolase|nr:MAG: bifunctional phosphoribosyl-AMP cyclohydrolase/phosphoribosyl-ATP diphosphatase [Sphingobacteriales bacterium UTBCD1]